MCRKSPKYRRIWIRTRESFKIQRLALKIELHADENDEKVIVQLNHVFLTLQSWVTFGCCSDYESRHHPLFSARLCRRYMMVSPKILMSIKVWRWLLIRGPSWMGIIWHGFSAHPWVMVKGDDQPEAPLLWWYSKWCNNRWDPRAEKSVEVWHNLSLTELRYHTHHTDACMWLSQR